jgi:hypothetical protein
MFPFGPDSEPSTRDFRPGRPVPSGPSPPGYDTATPSPATVSDAAARAIALHATLGDYDLLHVAGEGGMGVVYLARHRPSGRTVALKVMRPDMAGTEGLALRFRREMRIADAVRHPHIAPVGEVGEAGGRLYYTMPFAPATLAQRRQRYADPPAAARLLAAVARAVHHAHLHGIVHRDLKPANVLLTADGEPLVSDFGLARWVDASQELTPAASSTLGTPCYMAPEQIAGPTHLLGPSADVWALGVILYELLAGQRPFDGDGRDAVLHLIRTTDPAPPRQFRPDLDPALEAVVMMALRKAPAERYAMAAALADDLERWLAGRPVRAQAPPPTLPGRPAAAGWRPRAAAAAAVLLAAVPAALVFAGLGAAPPRADVADPGPDIVPTPAKRDDLKARLARGEAVGLVKPRQWPTWYGVRHGRPEWLEVGRSGPGRDTTVAVGNTLVLMDLLDAVPLDAYRLEAVLCHRAAAAPDSLVGLYVSYHDYPLGAKRLRVYTRLVFNDLDDPAARARQFNPAIPADERSPATGNRLRLELAVHFTAEHDPTGPELSVWQAMLGRDVRAVLPARPDPPAEAWRRVAVEVRPTGVRVFLQGQPLGEASAAQLDKRLREILSRYQIFAPADLVAVAPRGAAGLAVRSAGVAVRSVTLSPLSHKE